jgi:hypothetical protein
MRHGGSHRWLKPPTVSANPELEHPNTLLIQVKRLQDTLRLISWLPFRSSVPCMPPDADSSIQTHTYGSAMHDDRRRYPLFTCLCLMCITSRHTSTIGRFLGPSRSVLRTYLALNGSHGFLVRLGRVLHLIRHVRPIIYLQPFQKKFIYLQWKSLTDIKLGVASVVC